MSVQSRKNFARLRLAMLLLSAAYIGCDDREIEFVVSGIDGEVTAISIFGTLKGAYHSSIETTEPTGNSQMRIGARFESMMALLADGETAPFDYTVEGLRDDKCAVSAQSGTVMVTRHQPVHVDVALLREANAMCRVTITNEGIGQGSVTSTPAGISCGESCSARFVAGENKIVLTATGGTSSHFAGWDGDCSGNQQVCEISPVSRPYKVRAHWNRGVCTTSNWCWESPLPQGNRLQGVWGNPAVPGEIWAVGTGGTAMQRVADGSGWSAHPTGVRSDLSAISGVSSSDLWAVGFGGTILHWDGQSWRQDTSAATTVALSGVSAVNARQAWAVGEQGTILQMQDGIWQTKASNDINNNDLYRVLSLSPSSVFAVGTRGVVQRWDGVTWNPKPYTMTMPRELYGITGFSGSQLWAVGELGTILGFDGTNWTAQNMPSTGSNILFGVWGQSPQRLWAVGQSMTILQTQNGKDWQVTDRSKLPSGLNSTLYDVWGNGQQLWAVGDGGSILTSSDGQRWTQEDALLDPQDASSVAPHETIYAVAGSDTKAIWAVGEGGLILHWDGTRWKRELNPDDSIPGNTLRAVWAGGGQVLAAGDNGVVLRRSSAGADGSWQLVSLDTRTQLNAISANSAWVFVGGAAGALWRRDIAFTIPWQDRKYALEDLNAIWTQGSQVYVAGVYSSQASNIHLSQDEANRIWTPQSNGSTATLHAVWGGSDGDVWAAGESGVLRRTKGSWVTAASQPGETFFGLTGNASDVWAVGSKGTVLRSHAGGTLTPISTGTVLRFRGVSLTGSDTVVAVGDGGMILRYFPTN